MKVLLIESDSITTQSLKTTLQARNCDVHTTDCGEEGADLVMHYEYDVVLLGDGLPNSVDVVRRICGKRNTTPIIILHDHGDEQRQVKLLDLGADDCVQKPLNCDVLLARMRAVVRRSRSVTENVIRIRDVALDTSKKQVTVAGKTISLPPKMFAVLEFLMSRPNKTIARDTLFNYLYGGRPESDTPADTKVLQVYLSRLKRDLAAAGAEDFITNIHGQGYMIRSDTGQTPTLVGDVTGSRNGFAAITE